MAHCTCESGVPWCARTDELFGVEGMHVVDVSTRDDGTLVLDVETGQGLAGCAGCGVVAVGHGRRVVRLHDTPCFGRPVLVRWRKRIWRCAEASCEVSTWTEDHGYAPARSKLTTRAVSWAVDAWRHDDTTVSAIARHLGVDWHTAWAAIGAEAVRRTKKAGRLKGVKTLGVDEHIVRHEALLLRMEVRDLHRLVVVAAG